MINRPQGLGPMIITVGSHDHTNYTMNSRQYSDIKLIYSVNAIVAQITISTICTAACCVHPKSTGCATIPKFAVSSELPTDVTIILGRLIVIWWPSSRTYPASISLPSSHMFLPSPLSSSDDDVCITFLPLTLVLVVSRYKHKQTPNND